MILLDSIHINNSGGKVLLDYLVEEFERANLNIFYLFDNRCEGSFDNVPANRKFFIKASIINRYKFYKKNRLKFDKYFCFGNLPPLVQTNAKVYTYLHQRLFIEPSNEFSFRQRVIFQLKSTLFSYLKSNTNYWIVQTNSMKKGLELKFGDTTKIKVMPFYPSVNGNIVAPREKQTYVYVSGASPHKNHQRLIDAFCLFYDDHTKGRLTLTVNNDNPAILDMINRKIYDGYPIVNYGFINRSQLKKVYQESEYLIYPSLSESFGLGLIEAMECGCKVMGSDLPYTFDVCEPSIVFNPLDVKSIVKALEKSIQDEVKPTVQLVQNRISELIDILK